MPPTFKLRFFSESVVASLANVQDKVAQVAKAVCFSFDDCDLVVHPFQFAGVDGVVTVIYDAIAVAFKHLGKFAQGTVIQRSGRRAPMIQDFTGPSAGPVRPDMLELVF